jgi:malonyl CoA-acyl carrier protein transacylase
MSDMLEKALSGLGVGSSEGSTDVPASIVGGSKGGPGKSRCKRGSRRNKKTGECVRVAGYTAKRRCSRGTRRSAVTGDCERIETLVKKVAKKALGEVAVLKKADAAVVSASGDRLAAARAAAALKRQKKSAAKTARIQGKIAAAEAREKKAEMMEKDAEKERNEVLAKIARTRKAMGIRKNEDNPVALKRLIEQWEAESRMRLFKKYH